MAGSATFPSRGGPNRRQLSPYEGRGAGKRCEIKGAAKPILGSVSVANSVANPMDLTALNGRVTNTWKAKIASSIQLPSDLQNSGSAVRIRSSADLFRMQIARQGHEQHTFPALAFGVSLDGQVGDLSIRSARNWPRRSWGGG
jgi:hypothetical protein